MSEIICWNVTTDLARSWHLSIRHRVFVEEQQVIPITDVDDWDRRPDTIHALGCRDARAAGTVRLYRTDASGRWKGDRLAVLPQHRASLLGARLVGHAVATAASLGGTVMDALVQVQNVRFFERLGWLCDGSPAPYFGLAHQPMTYDLGQAAEFDVSEVPPDVTFELPAHRDSPSPLIGSVDSIV